MTRLGEVGLLLVLLLPLGCKSRESALKAFCAEMTAAGAKGEREDEAFDRLSRTAPSTIAGVFKGMKDVNPEDRPCILREYAAETGKTFDCPGWEFRLGRPKSPRIVPTKGTVAALAVHSGGLFWLEDGSLFRSELDGAKKTSLRRSHACWPLMGRHRERRADQPLEPRRLGSGPSEVHGNRRRHSVLRRS